MRLRAGKVDLLRARVGVGLAREERGGLRDETRIGEVGAAIGERDPLRDDTVLMARRWGEVADVELHLPPEAAHGFIRFPIALARQVQARTHAWLNERINARIAAVRPPP